VLAGFEKILRRNLPDDGKVIRVGGDEWVVVLPRASSEHALVVMDEIRQHIEQAGLAPGGRSITMSAGVASRPPHGATGEELLRCADEALFRGKREGRNRVAIYVEDRMVMKSNYYSRAALERLSRASRATDRTEASLLREALDDLLARYNEQT
jgi:predicted signal transduction protein with EAL and GGDEF domain